ncbi:MAG TPA: hypothetical protein PK668_28025 [Myxococcota bacterium]|nr:hypothetical protein [Myxococcota bacterium]HRY97346.1 hypothetical protein [Myxococcota bacterium]
MNALHGEFDLPLSRRVRPFGVMAMNVRLVLLWLALSASGCVPLWQHVGLNGEAALRTPEAIPALVKALEAEELGTDDTIAALKALAQFGKQAASALAVAEKRFLEPLTGMWPAAFDLAEAAADLLVSAGDPERIGPLFVRMVDCSNTDCEAPYLAALRALGNLGYARPEVVALLKAKAASPNWPQSTMEVSRAASSAAKLEALLGQQAAGEKKPEPVTAAAPTGIIVAVFELEDATQQLQGSEREQLYSFYATRLTELAGFKVVPRDQLRARLREQKTESYKACYDEACQIELGKELAAEKSLSTRILKVGMTCMVTSQLYDLKSSTAEKAATARAAACNADSLLEAMDGVARQIAAP